MKLWKENKTDKEWELSCEEVAKRFLESGYNNHDDRSYFGTARQLIRFISEPDGLNSIWDWDQKKGSIDGSPDILRILDLIKEKEKGLR